MSLRSGFLGLNKDFAAVPWSALDLTGQPGIAKLDADKQTLTAMAFNEDNFPNSRRPAVQPSVARAVPCDAVLGGSWVHPGRGKAQRHDAEFRDDDPEDGNCTNATDDSR